MKLVAKNLTERRLLDYLEANASPALREKIAALPAGDRYNLSAAYRHISDEARKELKSSSGFVDDTTVFGWLVHYYEDVAPAEAAKAAKAPAKRGANNKGGRKAASDKNAKPAAGSGAPESGFAFNLFDGDGGAAQ